MGSDSDRTDPGHDAIRRFYDLHPYPPPVADLDAHRDRWRDGTRLRAEHCLLFPGEPVRHDLEILVAGCGTSQAARYALSWPRSRVVGIDVGETSLRHTEELKRRYALENLEVRNLPVERIGELGRTFDLIVSTGVLHHLADPDVGLGALRSVLRPGGAMLMMVYARYGRTGVSMIQEYSRMLGVGASSEEVRALAETLTEIPADHPLVPLLRNSPDFRRPDALADALLNPRERTYTVPELFEFLRRTGLSFGRWYRQAPYRPQCGAVATTPHAALLQSLPEHEQFAAMELFRGAMVRHSVVVRRDDDPAVEWSALAGERWHEAVPVRLPNAIRVDERLPAGATAVLLNRSHTFTDLIMPVDDEQDRWAGAADGRRSLGEVMEHVGSPDEEAVRAFFRLLWWYDQVVFDVAAAPVAPT